MAVQPRAQPGTQLIKIFGQGEVGDHVKNYDFSKMTTTIRTVDKTKDDYLHLDLAPSYGTLTSAAVKQMDDNLKVMIAGTMNTLGKLPTPRSWESIISAFMQNPLLEPDTKFDITRDDKFIKNGSHDWLFDGSPIQAVVNDVHAWFLRLIGDEDIINSTKIDIDVLGKIVAQTGATVDSFEAFFTKHEYHEKTLIDIGVLRFPDITNPFFKVYRIQLRAWSDSSRVLFHQEDKNGITGEFNCRRYNPRAEVLNSLRQETRAKAVNEAESLFS